MGKQRQQIYNRSMKSWLEDDKKEIYDFNMKKYDITMSMLKCRNIKILLQMDQNKVLRLKRHTLLVIFMMKKLIERFMKIELQKTNQRECSVEKQFKK